MNFLKRHLVFIALGLSLSLAFSKNIIAQTYPNKPIKLIAPFLAGGPADNIAREVAKYLHDSLGQPVVVENKTGAGGIIAATFVAKSPSDGYTLMIGSTGMLSVNQSLYKSLPYDSVNDFTPISLLVGMPSYLVVNENVPANSIKELIELVRKSPGKYSYGTVGNGSSHHTNFELFNSMANVSVVPIAYKGDAALIPDLVGGHIDMAMGLGPSILPMVKSGKLKVLAVTTATRSTQMPNVPTIAESGLPGFDAFTWFALSGPHGMPQPIVAKLEAAMIKAFADPIFRAKFIEIGVEPIGSSAEKFAQFQKSEIQKWAVVVKKANMQIE
ncbi:MAG: tripartite tricarboxylate transporter substrate binding protein [Betaproteobacteria bacterium]